MYTLLYLFIYYIFKKFIFGCAGSSLLHAGFLSLQRAGLLSTCGAFVSPYGGFSVASLAMEQRLRSGNLQALGRRGLRICSIGAH